MRQEQNYFRQLIVWILRFTGQQSKARHAYEPLLPAVKTGQPHVCKNCKITIFKLELLHRLHFYLQQHLPYEKSTPRSSWQLANFFFYHEVVKFESKISEANNPQCSLRNWGKWTKPDTNPKWVEHCVKTLIYVF